MSVQKCISLAEVHFVDRRTGLGREIFKCNMVTRVLKNPVLLHLSCMTARLACAKHSHVIHRPLPGRAYNARADACY